MLWMRVNSCHNDAGSFVACLSSKSSPIAFSFDLLNWAEALLLECQVAMKDFCKALDFKCPRLIFKVGIDLFII